MNTKRKMTADAIGIRRYCKGRARKAESILAEFYDGDDIETSMGDLLSDLMHLAMVKGYDFTERLDRGTYHFNAVYIGGEHG